MPEGTVRILCPNCRHPYMMTPKQLELYQGRMMGCMACGRPFDVRPPPPPPPPPEPLIFTAEIDPGAPAGSDAGVEGLEVGAVRNQPAAAAAAVGRVAAISSPPVEKENALSLLDGFAIGAAVLFMVFAAIAAAAGNLGSYEDADHLLAQGDTSVLLLRLAVCSAAIGVIAGGFSLWKSLRIKADAMRPRRRNGHAMAAVGVGLAELIIAALLALLVWPPMARATADGARATCQENLEHVGNALVNAAADRDDGLFPDSLAELAKTDGVAASMVVCPAGKETPYIYLGKDMAIHPGKWKRASTYTIVAYEAPGAHGDTGGFHVLFADGKVVFVDKEQAAVLFGELQAGQNPPPTALTVR